MTDADKIRITISNHRLTHKWVIYQLHRRGIEVQKSEFSDYLNGLRKGPKADTVIGGAIDVLERYEQVCETF